MPSAPLPLLLAALPGPADWPPLAWIVVTALVLWCGAWIWVQHVWLPRVRARGGNWLTDVAKILLQPILEPLHHLKLENWDLVPKAAGPRGLIVVSNHTSLLDPVAIQSRIVPHVRWMMDRTQMAPSAAWFWRQQRIIPISYGPDDAAAVRDAMAHLRDGGVLGIFPEGGVERPQAQIRPFLEGVGALVARSRAPVLLLWIRGTPQTDGLVTTIFSSSRTIIRALEIIDFGRERDVRAITARLRSTLAAASGWPLNDEMLPSVKAALEAAVTPAATAPRQDPPPRTDP